MGSQRTCQHWKICARNLHGYTRVEGCTQNPCTSHFFSLRTLSETAISTCNQSLIFPLWITDETKEKRTFPPCRCCLLLLCLQATCRAGMNLFWRCPSPSTPSLRKADVTAAQKVCSPSLLFPSPFIHSSLSPSVRSFGFFPSARSQQFNPIFSSSSGNNCSRIRKFPFTQLRLPATDGQTEDRTRLEDEEGKKGKEEARV